MFWQQAERLKVPPGGVACLPLRRSTQGACMAAAVYGAAAGHVQPARWASSPTNELQQCM